MRRFTQCEVFQGLAGAGQPVNGGPGPRQKKRRDRTSVPSRRKNFFCAEVYFSMSTSLLITAKASAT